jgi:hypothetical protein
MKKKQNNFRRALDTVCKTLENKFHKSRDGGPRMTSKEDVLWSAAVKVILEMGEITN